MLWDSMSGWLWVMSHVSNKVTIKMPGVLIIYINKLQNRS
jgi:hypothetical protein